MSVKVVIHSVNADVEDVAADLVIDMVNLTVWVMSNIYTVVTMTKTNMDLV